MRIEQVLRRKGSAVATVAPQAPLRELLALLAEQGIGAAVVCDGPRVAGIVSERDVVRALHQRPDLALDVPVSELMTSEVLTTRPGEAVDRVSLLMTERRVRHVPVLGDDGALVGIVSIGDVVKSRIDELEADRDSLLGYVRSAP